MNEWRKQFQNLISRLLLITYIKRKQISAFANADQFLFPEDKGLYFAFIPATER